MPPFERPDVRVFQRSFVSRAPGPLGCLAALILLPIVVVFGLLVAGVATIVRLFTSGRRGRGAATFRPTSPESAAREEALRRLVRAMALDDTFTADEARQAGTTVAGGATVDDLLAEAVERRWIEVRGDRLAVTRRGRDDVDRLPG